MAAATWFRLMATTAKTKCSSRWVRPQQSCSCATGPESSIHFAVMETPGKVTSDLTLFILNVKFYSNLFFKPFLFEGIRRPGKTIVKQRNCPKNVHGGFLKQKSMSPWMYRCGVQPQSLLQKSQWCWIPSERMEPLWDHQAVSQCFGKPITALWFGQQELK